MSITNESDDYKQFSAFLQDACGILLGDNKAYLVNSRIKPVLVKYGLKDLSHLVAQLKNAVSRQLKDDVVDAMTTNETLWFRDNHPFHLLSTKLFPELAKKSLLFTHKNLVRCLFHWPGAVFNRDHCKRVSGCESWKT